MYLIRSDKIMPIISNALHECNEGMASHGMRISYMLYSLLKKTGKYDDEQIHNICLISALHDIGIYMMDDKTIASKEKLAYYTLYGYAFAKNLYPAPEYAKIILYHHFDNNTFHFHDMEFGNISQLIRLLNRVDSMYDKNVPQTDIFHYINKNTDRETAANIRSIHRSSDLGRDAILADKGFTAMVPEWHYSIDEIHFLLMMLVLMIDFKSKYTMDHTLSICTVARVLSELLELPLHDRTMIRTGAMLHDLGKIGIPITILDKPSKLNSKERNIMRSHVDITERILAGNVREDVINIAIRHHERLDGSGYGRGLKEEDLTLHEQLVAVADIFSALISDRSYKKPYTKEQVLRILTGMAKIGLINKGITQLCEKYFDYIITQVRIQQKISQRLYNQIQMEHEALLTNVLADQIG